MSNYKAMAGVMAALAAAPVVASVYQGPAIEQRLTADEVRNPLEKALAEICGKAEAAETKQLPQDKYNPKSQELSATNFRQTLQKEGLVWVMYDSSDPRMPSDIRMKGEKFWTTLKYNFAEQVNGFIRIDASAWPDYTEAWKEIKVKSLPSFILYRDGKIVSGGEGKDIILQGPPKDLPDNYLRYIKQNSPLK